MDELIKKYERRLARLEKRKEKISQEHSGKEEKYTYHGGFDLGYLKGKISEIENIIDELNDINK